MNQLASMHNFEIQLRGRLIMKFSRKFEVFINSLTAQRCILRTRPLNVFQHGAILPPILKWRKFQQKIFLLIETCGDEISLC